MTSHCFAPALDYAHGKTTNRMCCYLYGDCFHDSFSRCSCGFTLLCVDDDDKVRNNTNGVAALPLAVTWAPPAGFFVKMENCAASVYSVHWVAAGASRAATD